MCVMSNPPKELFVWVMQSATVVLLTLINPVSSSNRQLFSVSEALINSSVHLLPSTKCQTDKVSNQLVMMFSRYVYHLSLSC